MNVNELRLLAEDLHSANGPNRYASALSRAADEISQWRSVFGHLGTPDEVGNEWIDLTDRLKKVEAANKEWLEKTEWVQAEINNWMLPMRYLGQHRADIIRAEVDALRAKIGRMEKRLRLILEEPENTMSNSKAMREMVKQARLALEESK